MGEGSRRRTASSIYQYLIDSRRGNTGTHDRSPSQRRSEAPGLHSSLTGFATSTRVGNGNSSIVNRNSRSS